MSLDEKLSSEIQKLNPSSVIELFELDSTDLGGDTFRFHNGTNNLNQNLVWQGVEYTRFPIQVSGFEISGQGQFPRPTVAVSNVLSAMTAILLQYGDLVGAKFTRKRTMLKFLDAVNFPDGLNPTADPTVFLPDDVFYVDRKSMEDRDQVQFELASAADLQNVKIPKRVVIQSICPWVYRGPECNYTGPALWGEDDEISFRYAGASAPATAMFDAYMAFLEARRDLNEAQQVVALTTSLYTDAQKFSVERQYNYNETLSPHHYYVLVGPTKTIAVWDNVEVSLGTTYAKGDYGKTISEPSVGGLASTYAIYRYFRSEETVDDAYTDFLNALANRDAAQATLDAKIALLNTATEAVPSDDPVFRQDRCGKRLSSCRLRFDSIYPNSPLNFGGFPGVSR